MNIILRSIYNTNSFFCWIESFEEFRRQTKASRCVFFFYFVGEYFEQNPTVYSSELAILCIYINHIWLQHFGNVLDGRWAVHRAIG